MKKKIGKLRMRISLFKSDTQISIDFSFLELKSIQFPTTQKMHIYHNTTNYSSHQTIHMVNHL